MSDENSGNVCQAHNGHAGEQGVGDPRYCRHRDKVRMHSLDPPGW